MATSLKTDLFDRSQVSSDKRSKTVNPLKIDASLSGIIRLNKEKVYPANGIGPKQYILDRIEAVDRMTVEEARLRKFPDKHGKDKRYSGDIAYDAATGWIRIEMVGSVNTQSSEPAETRSSVSEPQTVGVKPLFTKVVGLDRPHPEGEVSTVVGRRRRRIVQRALRRRPAPRLAHRIRGRAMPRQVCTS